jgi:hypothetical protein
MCEESEGKHEEVRIQGERLGNMPDLSEIIGD